MTARNWVSRSGVVKVRGKGVYGVFEMEIYTKPTCITKCPANMLFCGIESYFQFFCGLNENGFMISMALYKNAVLMA